MLSHLFLVPYLERAFMRYSSSSCFHCNYLHPISLLSYYSRMTAIICGSSWMSESFYFASFLFLFFSFFFFFFFEEDFSLIYTLFGLKLYPALGSSLDERDYFYYFFDLFFFLASFMSSWGLPFEERAFWSFLFLCSPWM